MSLKMLWQQIPNHIVTDIMTQTDVFDGVVLDTEHAGFNIETIVALIALSIAKKKECFVRLTEPNEAFVRQCLDAGATGIICANVDRTKAIKLREMCYYPPRGKRGLGLTRSNMWGTHGYLKNDRNLKIIAQIESEYTVRDIIGITLCYDFDYYMIGPYDLSMDLGCPGNFKNSKYIDCINLFKKSIPKEKRGYHVVHVNSEYSAYLEKIKDEYEFVAYGLDTLAIIEYIKYIEKQVEKGNLE